MENIIEIEETPLTKNVQEEKNLFRNNHYSGLTSVEANERLKNHGLNRITEEKRKSAWLIFFNQFKSPIVFLLVFASALSFYFGEILDGIAIFVVIIINSLIGFYMEHKAERSMDALKKLSAV